MILILENLGQKLLSVEVLHQPRLCRLLTSLNGITRSGLSKPANWFIMTTGLPQNGRTLPPYWHRPLFLRRRICIHKSVTPQSRSLPLAARGGLPFHIVRLFALKLGVIALEQLHFKLSPRRALHLLERAVKSYCCRRSRDIYIPARFALKNSSLKRTLTVKRLYVFTAAKAAWNFRYRHKEKSN